MSDLRHPLLDLHRQGDAQLMYYAIGESASADAAAPGPPSAWIVEAFDPVPVEYAALRTHAAIFDMPHRSTLIISGSERQSFLNRMLTQELKDLGPFMARRSFWLNRKGRIDADLRLIELGDRTIVDVDILAARRARTGLEAFIITEECAIEDASARFARLSIHGPASAALVARLSRPVSGVPIAEIAPGQVAVVEIAGAEVVIDRQDTTGEIGLELLAPMDAAASVYQTLSPSWAERPAGGQGVMPTGPLARRIGWHAVNIARIENFWPMYYADFGPDSLPAETGERTLNDRVSFKKGCYLGQEVVARMHALGHPKQRLVGLRLDVGQTPGATSTGAGNPLGLPDAPQAVTGTMLVGADEPGAPAVGAVTSSCLAPMLSQAHIAIAMVKWSHASPGTVLFAQLDDRRIRATVTDGGPFVRR